MILVGRMRHERGSAGETLGRKIENPRAVFRTLGFLSQAQIRQANRAAGHRGMGTANGQLNTHGRGTWSGMGCRTVSLTTAR
jgi:hypothetical protein